MTRNHKLAVGRQTCMQEDGSGLAATERGCCSSLSTKVPYLHLAKLAFRFPVLLLGKKNKKKNRSMWLAGCRGKQDVMPHRHDTTRTPTRTPTHRKIWPRKMILPRGNPQNIHGGGNGGRHHHCLVIKDRDMWQSHTQSLTGSSKNISAGEQCSYWGPNPDPGVVSS